MQDVNFKVSELKYKSEPSGEKQRSTFS